MLDGHSAVLWQSNVYIWGGKDETPATANRPASRFFSSTMYMMNGLELVNPNSFSVAMSRVPLSVLASDISGGASPRGRAYHTATIYGKYMFVVGGLMDESAVVSGNGQQNESNNNVVLPIFDLELRTWVFKSSFGDVPCARCHHVAVVYGDTLMVHGGYPVLPGGQDRDMTAEEMATMQHAMFDVHELNVTTLRWRRISTAQSPALWGHTSVVFNKNVIVFGGVDVVEDNETGAVAVWHQEKKLWRWADFQSLDLQCAMHTAVIDGARMLVYGGVSFKTQKKLRSLFEFNLEFGSWRELLPRGHIPLGRIGHAAVMFQQHMIVIGGAAEGSGAGELSTGDSTAKYDRKVYVYNVQSNDWRAMGIVDGGEIASADDATSVNRNRLNPNSFEWSINKSNAPLNSDASAEWDATANRVRDTLTRAKAIQNLADAATGALLAQPGVDASTSPQAAPQSMQQQQAQSIQRLQRQADSNTNFEYYASQPGGVQSVVTNNDDARKVIDHLVKENEKLRNQLDEFRSLSLNGVVKNPYEVPVFNPASAVLPESEHLASPGRARDAARLDGNTALSELAPRLNINVAEPPRAVGTGGSATGYMTRTAVSALVSASIRDQPASMSLAANLRASASLDPMSYLTQTPHVAALQATSFGQATGMQAGSYQPAKSYEQLLGRNGLVAQPSGAYSSNAAPPVPNSLKPLLAVLTGGSIPGTSMPSPYSYPASLSAQPGSAGNPQTSPIPSYSYVQTPQQYYQQPPQHQQLNTSNSAHAAQWSGYAPQGPFAGNEVSMQMPSTSPASSRHPSLAKLVTGQASMLSLGLLK